MALFLLQDDHMKRTYRLDDDREINIVVDESLQEIYIEIPERKKIGEIILHRIDTGQNEEFKITHMFMDMLDASYKRKGIGHEALKFFKEITGGTITAEENDGIRKEDGSHLTGDAVEFVAKMREEGIIKQGMRYQ